jgi:hypothetical protein
MKEKQCKKCKDFWPSDTEFFSPVKSLVCRACRSEQRKEFKRVAKEKKAADAV